MDSDHRILFDLLCQLHDATETGQSRDVVGNVIRVLAEYTEYHFRREEEIMAAAQCPTLEGHRREHAELELRVRDLRDRYCAGEWTVLGEDVVALLKKWLTDHILVTDKSYRPWVERASGDGPGTAVAAG
ncbi:Hemerythrin-like protein [Candidatus Terasakiella magnetica]|nr:Hemerythrin-like protein [Candidatus Terasakiella magnetica]